ncbi:MAG: uracil-DNA glycosylase family protein [Halanaeroarchaeum sp.]
MENVTDRIRNPFDLDPPCERFVPGYGDANADVHVIGDHPGIHGGIETGIPFTDSRAGDLLRSVLADVGLLEDPGPTADVQNLFLSYLHPCLPDGAPTPDSYRDMERFFDAELRAITAHVLVPVGDRPVRHVLEHFTTVPAADVAVADVHARELSSGGWLVIPVAEPTTWSDGDRVALLETLSSVLDRDYRRESDLGRFLTDPDPYLVR